MFHGHLKIILLKAIAKKACSGYDLMKSIEQAIGSKPSPGSVYPLLDELASRDFVSSQIKGKSKVYTITPDGKAELKLLQQKRDEILESMKSNLKMWGMISGEDVSSHIAMFESLSRDELPFQGMSQEICTFKDILGKICMMHDAGKRKKARRVVQEAIKKMQRLA